jgi:hypothetical protein
MTHSKEDAHDLMPARLAAHVPALYSQEENPDPTVWAVYFTPDFTWTWYVLEYSPVAPDGVERLCFGLVDGYDTELGYFCLDDLESVRGPLGLQIERDLSWKPRPLSQVKKELE